MTNHEMAIRTAQNIENNLYAKNLFDRYDADPNSLTEAEFGEMMLWADLAMPLDDDEMMIALAMNLFDD